ncbi:methionine synthase (B12-dependent) [Syntrophobotulus glycolicus DSM 8271]|uniref:Methionine synthase n=1 Tax=Syntrophobotulus glycolicus (strain DSM 8271 / FlGlyR) TaxID=645991 RepID=F0SYH1_SYNGF|nr:methionine synthase [Syntrophobotulus glycolicus]ADY57083.1 methionine synthase (B12-dependent) [Syntrophobotulus glycolicus DSM 8271]
MDLFKTQLEKKILILDGAMGTMLQRHQLKPDDFGQPEYDGCNEILNLSQPDLIKAIHEAYLDAGADIIETNSFGATNVVLEEYGLADRDIELNEISARLAREAADARSTKAWPRFVAGSMGPTIRMLTLSAGITFEELEEAYYRQALGLIKGGADLLLVETCQDTLNVKAAGIGIGRAFHGLGKEIPIMISCTIEPSGTMLAGQNIQAFYLSVKHLNPAVIGLNCGTGADGMREHVRTLAGIASCAVSCHANAGLPDEEGNYLEQPRAFAAKQAEFARNGWLNIAGGCCGTTPEHIKALAEELRDCRPRAGKQKAESAVSGIEPLWLEKTGRPILVGERSNVIGSRLFRDLIVGEHYEEGSEVARGQVKKGAHVVDICVANPDRDEYHDMVNFLSYVVKKVKVPLMLDSTDAQVVEAGLKMIQGKAIINSINLENGLERFEQIVPLIHKYGAAIVVGLIDEQGMALSREDKLRVAERSCQLLTERYALQPGDIIFDPLTFPVGTGDPKYLGSAKETIEGLRLIKEKIPACKTILGVSNVSFGLPTVGREVLNAVFVHHNTLAGLDYAIVNAEKHKSYADIPEEERKLAEDLLFQTNDRTLKNFTDFYRDKKAVPVHVQEQLSWDQRLARNIVDGSKEGLEADLSEGLKTHTPLELINGPLLKGMDEVGRLFNRNMLIVAEVLQSAEVMKAAVGILEKHMDKTEEAIKGKLILATVKGDVHDIGKNLVEIILSNNGYQVINLGVKVSPEEIIKACREHKPDAVGLSGLLVKSVQQMLVTAQEMRAENIKVPLILGGAALSRKFTEEKIAPAYDAPAFYCQDAMEGLKVLQEYLYAHKDTVIKANQDKGIDRRDEEARKRKTFAQESRDTHPLNETGLLRSQTDQIARPLPGPIYVPSDLQRHVLLDFPLQEIIRDIDVKSLMKFYLGIGKKKPDTLQEMGSGFVRDTREEELAHTIQQLFNEIVDQKMIKARGVYRFLPARSAGNLVRILNPENHEEIQAEFLFPRQTAEPFLSPADYIQNPINGKTDYLGLFTVTTGVGLREKAQALKDGGQYLKSYLLQVISLKMAEAMAEKVHEIMRKEWGLPEREVSGNKEKNRRRYQGIRLSPGYPLCPDLEAQRQIFKLLQPEDIGITLTESLMMDPEASVSALVFAHPEARIFSL